MLQTEKSRVDVGSIGPFLMVHRYRKEQEEQSPELSPSAKRWLSMPFVRAVPCLIGNRLVVVWEIVALTLLQILSAAILGLSWSNVVPMVGLVLFEVCKFTRQIRKISRAVARFHAAEHMVINCIEAGCSPTPENVWSSSKFSHACGSASLSCDAVATVLAALLLARSGNWMMIVLIGNLVGSELFVLVNTTGHWILRPIAYLPQLWVCKKPTDYEVKVAALAGQALLELESQL